MISDATHLPVTACVYTAAVFKRWTLYHDIWCLGAVNVLLHADLYVSTSRIAELNTTQVGRMLTNARIQQQNVWYRM